MNNQELELKIKEIINIPNMFDMIIAAQNFEKEYRKSDFYKTTKMPLNEVIKNAKALANTLMDEGFNLISGGTDNHLMLVDLRNMNITGKELQNRLDEVYITLNKNAVPNDPQSPFVTSGVRIGTPAVTTRGLVEEDMKKIARLIKLTITNFDTKADYIRNEVTKICEKYPLYE